jgi:flagellar motility protein MotE (MotC chaperone)
MKFLSSMWFVSIVALLLGVGVQSYLVLSHVKSLEHVVESPEEVLAKGPPKRINWDFLSPEIENLRNELRERMTKVAKREEELHDYEMRLKAERAEIEKIKRDVEAVRTDLSTRLIDIEVSEQKNLKNLAATYSGLTPTAALAIFKEMDDDMVVKILAFMKPDPVGQILEEMARTKDGEGTLAGRAAALSYKLRLLRQVKPESNS